MKPLFYLAVLVVTTGALAATAAADQGVARPRQVKGDFIDYDRTKSYPKTELGPCNEIAGTGAWMVLHPVSRQEPGYLERKVKLFPCAEARLEMATRGWADFLCRVLVTPEGGQSSEIFRRVVGGGPYLPFSLDLTAFAGQTITVRYECVATGWEFEHAGIDYFYIHQQFDPHQTIQDRILAELTAWQARGKFEKAADYDLRTSPENRARMVATLQEQILAEYAECILAGGIVAAEYNADAEVFALQFEFIEPFMLPVPVADAPHLDENLHRLGFTNQRLAYTDGTLRIAHLEVTNPADLKLYTYDGAGPGVSATAPPTEFVFPRAERPNAHAVAVVIGNRDYRRTRPVEFALNDAREIRRMLIESLGYQEGSVILVENATQGDLQVIFGTADDHRGRLKNAVKPHESDVFVYYSGHGAPGLKGLQAGDESARGHLLPVECDPQYVELGGYPLDTLYANLAKLEARAVSVVIDACFSGEPVFDSISPVAIEVASPTLSSEMVLMAASSSRQVSCWHNEQQHGLFTYQILAGISGLAADLDRNGVLTYAELFAFVADRNSGVPYQARRLHGVEQDPVIQGSYDQKVLIGDVR